MILTTYFTAEKDPQRGERVQPNDPKRLVLLQGASRLGIPVTVFHDQLSPAFVSEHSSPVVTFHRVRPHEYLSCNDFRFFVFRNWLAMHPCDSVWCSDLFDVRVNKDPGKHIADLLDGDQEIAVGAHNDWKISAETADGRYICNMLKYAYGAVPRQCLGKPILMAGTWGGRYSGVLRALVTLCAEIATLTPKRHNVNLAAFQSTMFRYFGEHRFAVHKAPFVSGFRKYDQSGKTIFAHK